jgi:hypothetical protein
MRWLVGGSYGGVGVAMPQSLRGVGVAREGVAIYHPNGAATVFAFTPSNPPWWEGCGTVPRIAGHGATVPVCG